MRDSIIHVFRNTPFGRSSLLQSAYFAELMKVRLEVYIPNERQFIMYFQHSVVTVNLSKGYLRDKDTAEEHVKEVLRNMGADYSFFHAKPCAATGLPEIPTDIRFFAAPRCLMEHPRKAGLGHLGPRVRNIIRNAMFPIFIPALAFRPWKQVTVLFGGSGRSLNAVRLAEEIRQVTELPLSVFTHSKDDDRESYAELLQKAGLEHLADERGANWIFRKDKTFEDALWHLPDDALLVASAFGGSPIKERLLGTRMEQMQNEMPNPMLIIGPFSRAFTVGSPA
ncbi:MAG: hypothetical protein GXP49_03410 [Deltaproteobacteria bacterium]|nr:hypothetical protein [Deltaproteobacteria bacterium]